MVEAIKTGRDERVLKMAFPLNRSQNAYQPQNKKFLNANQASRKITS